MKLKLSELNMRLREIRRDIEFNLREKNIEEVQDMLVDYDDLMDKICDRVKILKYKNKDLKRKIEKLKDAPMITTPPILPEETCKSLVTDNTETENLKEENAKLEKENNDLRTQVKALTKENADLKKHLKEDNYIIDNAKNEEIIKLKKLLEEKDKQMKDIIKYSEEIENKYKQMTDPNIMRM